MNTSERDSDVEQKLVDLMEELEAQQRRLAPLVEAVASLEGSGLLDLLEVLAAREEDRSEQLYEAFTEEPANLRAVQNLGLAAGAVSEMDPNQLAAALKRVGEGHAVEAEALADPPRVGLWGALRRLQDPDVQRGLGFLLTLLKMVGSRSEPPPSNGQP